MHSRVDVAIIGAGTAGLNAMSQVRRAGRSFVLIDGGELGTTCARVGCMPSKALIQVAEDFHRRAAFARHGIEGGEELALDDAEAMEHVRHLRDLFVDRVLGQSIDELGEEFLAAPARFLGPDRLLAGDQEVRFSAAVIATGSRPVVPEPWQALGPRVLTTDSLFELERLPRSLAVVGLGVIGLELGQALARLGVEVVGADRLAHPGGLSDPVVAALAAELIGADLPLWLDCEVELRATAEGLEMQAGERRFAAEAVLAAMGRRAATAALDLDAVGAVADSEGRPGYDPQTMQIGDLPVFFAGDVTGDRQILHEAGDEGRIAGFNAALLADGERPRRFRRKTPLAIVFSDPQIATVGADWASLRERDDVAVGEMRLGPLGRALIMARNKGIIRLYAERRGGRLLGATLLGPGAEHLAHSLAWSIEQGLSAFDLLRMPFYHPTLEEGIQAALYHLKSQLSGTPDGLLESRPA